jgi:SanA protein
MPFTFSHPAAILPLRYLPQRLYSLTGLVIGSMTPDFEYFIRMTVGSIYSHSLGGLFYFDLPLGVLLCFIFHDIVRNELIDHLPTQLRERFWNLKVFNWNGTFKKNWMIVILSILLGAASHILWDGFTHPLGYFVMKSAFLQHKILVFGHGIAVYNILQNLSSLIGGIIVLMYIRRLPETKAPLLMKKDFYWTCVIIIMIVIMIIRFLNGLTIAKYGNVIVSIISSFFIAVILIPIFRFYFVDKMRLKTKKLNIILLMKRMFITFLALILVCLVTIYTCNKIIVEDARTKLYSDILAIPYNQVGLLLGTSKTIANGQSNPFYAYRVRAAVALIQRHKIKYLIISGDNSRKNYNEPESMRSDLIKAGIDSSVLFLDYAGFRTFDSIKRLKEIFGQDSVTIISQKFHNERAIYIADHEGISAIGFNARDVGAKQGLRTEIREKLARVKVFVDSWLGTKPKYLGSKVVIPS